MEMIIGVIWVIVVVMLICDIYKKSKEVKKEQGKLWESIRLLEYNINSNRILLWREVDTHYRLLLRGISTGVNTKIDCLSDYFNLEFIPQKESTQPAHFQIKQAPKDNSVKPPEIMQVNCQDGSSVIFPVGFTPKMVKPFNEATLKIVDGKIKIISEEPKKQGAKIKQK